MQFVFGVIGRTVSLVNTLRTFPLAILHPSLFLTIGALSLINRGFRCIIVQYGGGRARVVSGFLSVCILVV